MIADIDPVHLACIGEMKDAMARYEKKLSVEELIAISAQLTGNLFGMRHIMSPAADVQETMDLVIKNIDLGTAMAMAAVETSEGNLN